MKIAISACLLGENCKYNGGNNFNSELLKRIEKHEILSICPEVEGGLSVPRDYCEISDGKVMSCKGVDVTSSFEKGAKVCLKKVMDFHADLIIVQSRSPSCGVNEIYDGSFSHTKIKGNGIFVQKCIEAGLKVIDIKEYLNYE